jgi:hypothetical protein
MIDNILENYPKEEFLKSDGFDDCLQQAKSPKHLRTLRSKTFQGIADAMAE